MSLIATQFFIMIALFALAMGGIAYIYEHHIEDDDDEQEG